MLPKQLIIQAFGPFVTKQCIDFTELEKQHLFLIRGETGSGKTMILDALTYALYGKSSGGQREDFESMRSRFAKDEQISFIDYTFVIHGRTYRFYRGIEVKQKRNKEKVNKVILNAGEIIDGVFQPFFENPKIRNMEEKAIELIGLTHEQFIQVMILPQGKFEQLLTSKSEEKQAILKTLFQMERWETINEYLIQKVKMKRLALDEKKQKIDAFLSGVRASSYEEVLQWSEDAKHQTEDLHKISLTEDEELVKLSESIQVQKQYQIWDKEQEQAKFRQHQLAIKRDSFSTKKKLVMDNERLQKLVPYYQVMKKAQQELIRREASYAKVKQEEELVQLEIAKQDERKENINQLCKREEYFVQQLQRLEEASDVYIQYQSVAQQKVQHKAMLLTMQRNLQQHIQHGNVLKDGLIKLQKKMEGLQHEIVDKLSIEKAYYNYTLAKKSFDRIQSIQAEQIAMHSSFEVQSKVVENEEQQLQFDVEQYDYMFRLYLDNTALQLASTLEDSKPCPVCGSIHHPNPTQLTKQYVEILSLKDLQERVDQQKQKVANCKLALHRISATIEQQENHVKGLEAEIEELLHQPFQQDDFELWSTKYHEMQRNEQALQTTRLQKDKQQEQIEQQENERKRLEDSLHEFEQTIAINETKFLAYESRLLAGIHSKEALDRTLLSVRQEAVVNKQQLQDLQQLIQRVTTQYETNKQAVIKESEELQKAQKLAQEAHDDYVANVFVGSIAEVDFEQMLDEHQLLQLRKEIEQYEIECIQVDSVLCDIDNKLALVSRLDITSLLANHAQKTAKHKETLQEYADVTSRLQLYQQVLKQVKDAQEEIEKEQPRYIKMNEFVRAMRGDNSIGIERYVLGIMLSSITQSANQLLKKIHDGRYQLYRSDEASGKTRKYGLELSIYDSYSCANRSVVSLSGGEKFLVSLALSLALSAVVQARNGGIHLDAMFIDEGFGTLDEHSIADALAILQTVGMRKGLIGIISHVEVLKENISAGIEVNKTREGSMLHIRKG